MVTLAIHPRLLLLRLPRLRLRCAGLWPPGLATLTSLPLLALLPLLTLLASLALLALSLLSLLRLRLLLLIAPRQLLHLPL